LILWTFTDQLGEALAFVILFGAVSGAVIGLPPASVADILGPNPSMQAKLGQWTGQMYTIAAPFALTGPVIAGYLVEKYNTFLTVQLWSGVCLLLSAIFMAISWLCTRRDVKAEERRKLAMVQSGMSSVAVSAFTSRLPSRDGWSGDEESVPAGLVGGLPVRYP
jgi:MCP family monocarboxylic acid transporter-like MFS transporter 10